MKVANLTNVQYIWTYSDITTDNTYRHDWSAGQYKTLGYYDISGYDTIAINFQLVASANSGSFDAILLK